MKIYDVIIIGSGGAGLSAALEAKQYCNNVLVISKTYPTQSLTSQAQGGINAVLNEKKNSIERHKNDTKKNAHNLFNHESINTLTKNAKETIKWLDDFGVPFSRNDEGKISQRPFGASSEDRTCYSSDYTGLKIIHTLYDNCIKNNITFLNEHYLLKIIKNKNHHAIGVSVLNIKDSQCRDLYAKNIIIATGGYSNIFKGHTTNSNSSTSEGLMCALKAGCILSNIEMVQFHPTSLKNFNILISESARGEGAYIVDENKKRFVDELKPRDEVTRAIIAQMKISNVFLDLRHISEDIINTHLPQEKRLINDFLKLNVHKDLIPIEPSAHYTMGGIKSNVSCETFIKNLFVCGECAEAGIHGANRIGGNSLLEIITFGRIAGRNASKNLLHSIEIKNTNYMQKTIDSIFKKENTKCFYKDKQYLHEKLFNTCGIIKEEKRIKDMINEFKTYKNSYDEYGIIDKDKTFNQNLCDYLEFGDFLDLALIYLSCALQREESRGSHYREDFPSKKKNFEQSSFVKIESNKIIFGFTNEN